MTFFYLSIVFWLTAWSINIYLSKLRPSSFTKTVAPILFGLSIIILWESSVDAFQISFVILPAPSQVFVTFFSSLDILWVDFVQTFLKGALSGFVIGCSAAIITALLVDRFIFLERGLLPIGNLLSAMPIIGTAPILVAWFGFDWQSKAAVVVAMVFFPMLINTVQGIKLSDKIYQDLMSTYSSSYMQTLLKLRLPAAMPFIFNGLKICSTLSLIGAIVAEFFGSPIKGMGFRISTEAGRFALDMVWAEIFVAAITGTLFYGVLALLEKIITHWHPSQRGRVN